MFKLIGITKSSDDASPDAFRALYRCVDLSLQV